MAGIGFFVLIAVIGGAIAIVGWQMEQAKRKRYAAYAASVGLRYDHGPQPAPPVPFQQFSIGSSRRARHIFWKEGDPNEGSVFEYQYTTGSGKNRQIHRYTCATFRTNLWGPHLVLDRQGFFRDMLNSLGLRDIQVEWPVFNDTWHVSCQDERFAITVLDPPMMNWLMTVGGAGSVELELLGDRALVITRTMPVEQMVTLLDYGRQFLAQIPKVVPDLYPRPR